AGELFSQMIPLENYCQNLPDEFHGLQVGRKKIYTEMFQGNLVHTPTVVLRADWARQVGPFDTQMRNGGEDYKYHLRTCRLGELAIIDVSSIRYRIGMGDNITRKANNLNFALSYLRTITEEMNE